MKKILTYTLSIYFIFSAFTNVQAQNIKQLKGTEFPKEVKEVKLYTQTGETILFKTILKELKGNVIYLDFWASWCGPCIKEMPHSKKVQDYFKDKKVFFLYLSTDLENEKWQNGMKRINIKGHHYRIDAESKMHFKNLFKIRGIPYYVLIDKKGNIAEPKAKWPREKDLLKDITNILNNN